MSTNAVDSRSAAEIRKMVIEKERAICATLHQRDEAAYPIAERLLCEALQAVGDDPHRAVLLERQATLFRLRGEYDQAEKSLREALGICKGKFGTLAVETSRMRSKLCLLFETAGKAPDAVRAFYEECIESAGRLPPNGGVLMLELGSYELRRGRFDEAHELCARALPELLAATDRIPAGAAATCQRNLGDIKFARGEYRMARSYYDQAIRYGDATMKEALAARIADLAYETDPSWTV